VIVQPYAHDGNCRLTFTSANRRRSDVVQGGGSLPLHFKPESTDKTKNPTVSSLCPFLDKSGYDTVAHFLHVK
jgi:hypothetical protein